ncbi:TolC family protein [Mucilaginibacter sp. E4BP6]|uniref:TolC family protein n=1 Tax=Mucilaginibacter sp. E4BP6 TaxID=2723089 RepID=UPI0015CB32C1|nr:TolC family protein [Mucilaginibacter sp. E4BP6]NYE65455.1 outer membrane protein TolC [Mucilaginibacter sp. E4BP6]
MKWFFSILICLFSYSVCQAQTYSLDHYLQLAHTNSALLKDLQNQIASNQIDSLRLRAGLKPQVNVNSGGLYAPIVNGYGYSEAITNEHTLNGLMQVQKTILGRNNVNTQVETLNLQTLSLNNQSKISEQDLRKAITTQYITAYGDLQQYKFSQDVVKLLSTEEGLLKKLTRSNVYRQSDYLTFLVTLKQQELTLTQARLLYKNDFATLNYLAGVADTSIRDLDEPALQRNIKPDVTSSIYFQQYKLDSLKLINSKQLIDYAYKPKLNVQADGGYNSDFMGQAWKNFGLSAGFGLVIPIYDGGQRKLQYRKLSLQEETRQNYKAFFDVQYRQQVAQLNQQITENETLIAQIKDQTKYTESLIKVDMQLMQTGDLHISDLVLAINNYLTIKNLMTQTVISRLQLINQLNYWNK